MSDPIANAEIEDVLSSIRRLVSSEDRADRPARPAPAAGARLVLTPSQRVDGTTADDEVPEDGPEDAPQDFETDMPGDVTGPNARAERFDTVEDAEIIAEPGSDADRADDSGWSPGKDSAGMSARFLRHAPQEADTPDAVARSGAAGADHAEPVETPEPEPEPQGASADDTRSAGVEPDAREVTNAPEQPDTPDAAGLSEIEARAAGFESVVARQPGDWEPDGAPGEGDYAPDPVSPLPWDDLDEDTGDGSEDASDAGTAGGWYSDEALIDEAALRDLVAEIVRQELQGALGERITRNVRKLVRREIHRALMSQGLDED